MNFKLSCEVGGRELTIEYGKIAKQTHGSVLLYYGDSTVLVTAVRSEKPGSGTDFLPLTCDYIEKTFAAGKFPGGFFKREGRPTEREVLTSRLIDRPIRPLFPKGFFNELQIIATVLSIDQDNDPDVHAITGASAALMSSDIPFEGPIAGIRVIRTDGKFIVNPKEDEFKTAELNIAVAVSEKAIVMVEGGAKEISEEIMLEALELARKSAQPIIQLQKDLAKKVGKEKFKFEKIELDPAICDKIKEISYKKMTEAITIDLKMDRSVRIKQIFNETIESLGDSITEKDYGKVRNVASEYLEEIIRNKIVKDKKRIGNRGFDDIREINCEIGFLPRTHGSAIFTRGETQSLVTTTLGTSEDEQRIDNAFAEYTKNFMVHYNFPPFSTGEVKFLRGPGRREIGHGILAERAISYVLPEASAFPYTVRIVSEILESNGSSSMATVCGATLALMDAGVPIKTPVAGIAMGLIKEDSDVIILTDILGDEDHVGDMDFKVAGTKDGITAIQMDIKISGITSDILTKALEKAKKARLAILETMNNTIGKPREGLSDYAPRIKTIFINPAKIKNVIGPGGSIIKSIIEKTGAKIDIEDDGKVNVFAVDGGACDKALELINSYTEEAEEGKIYIGKVKKIMDFGAFVQILPNVEGLVHISQLDEKRIDKVSDVVKVGDEIAVKVIEIERNGRIRLSRKDAIKK